MADIFVGGAEPRKPRYLNDFPLVPFCTALA